MAISKQFKRMVFHLIVNVIASSFFVLPRVRFWLLKQSRLDINQNIIRSKCFFSTNNINIGRGTFINGHCKFYSSEFDGGRITIGENCYLAMSVLVCTMTHDIGEARQRAGKNQYHPVNIGDGTWVGANSTILPGVDIGRGCIIAAGSVVNKDCEPNGLYAGVPARRIKDLPTKAIA